jgi:hypothetical protein
MNANVPMRYIAGLAAALSWEDPRLVADTPAPRVGVYDSRLVAYACFWSRASLERRNRQIDSAKAARATGHAAEAERL